MSIRETPLIRCLPLESQAPGRVYLKLECLQNTGSFKLRGATRAISALSSEKRMAGVVTASAGNHGAGLALAAQAAQVNVTVFVPKRTPKNKQDRMIGLGATLRVEGENYDESEGIARRYAAQRHAVFVSAFDDDEVMAGNGGDLGREIMRQHPETSSVLVPIGGGGLIAGMAAALMPMGVTVIGAQPANNCAMYDSLACGYALCEYDKASTVAEGCEGAVCERTYAEVKKHSLKIGLASEKAILRSVEFLYRRCGVIAETSAVVPIAALLEQAIVPPTGDMVVVISGGNIDPSALDQILACDSESEHETNAP